MKGNKSKETILRKTFVSKLLCVRARPWVNEREKTFVKTGISANPSKVGLEIKMKQNCIFSWLVWKELASSLSVCPGAPAFRGWTPMGQSPTRGEEGRV